MTTPRVFHPDHGWFEPKGTITCEYGPLIVAPAPCGCPGCTVGVHPKYALALPAGVDVAPCQLLGRAGLA